MPYAFAAGITQAQAKAACQSALTDYGYTTTVSGYLNTSMSSRAIETSVIVHAKSALTNYGYTSALSTKLNAKIDTTISSRASSAGVVANVQSGLTAQGYTAGRAAYLDNIQKDIEDAVGSLAMTGTELTVREFTSLTQRMDCFIDLSVLLGGDTVVLKQYMKVKSGGTYRSFGTGTYTGVQTDPLVYVDVKPAKYGFKITLNQTGGTNRTIDWETFKQVKSS